jgi:hypothetical protein
MNKKGERRDKPLRLNEIAGVLTLLAKDGKANQM